MNNKPKCPVFGCTIPRGIPHEHPAGVSAVMRDPAEPLNNEERAELEMLRSFRSLSIDPVKSGTAIHEFMIQAETFKRLQEEGIHIVRDAPMVPGRKLRDSLLQAGWKSKEEHAEYCRLRRLCPETGIPLEIVEADASRKNTISHHPGGKWLGRPIKPPRSFLSVVGKIASWITSMAGLVLIAGVIALNIGKWLGWWS